MPKNQMRPKGEPWTNVVEPDEKVAFCEGRRLALAGLPLPRLLADDRHAWRGAIQAAGDIPAHMQDDWLIYCAEVCWWLPVPDETLVLEQVYDLATPDEQLLV